MELTAREKDILATALYTEVAEGKRAVDNESMGIETYSEQINTIYDIIEKLKLRDVIQEFNDSEWERITDENARKAHDAYHSW